MTKKGYTLHDADAQKIFDKFKGIDRSDRRRTLAQLPITSDAGISGVISQIDAQKLYLLDIAGSLSEYFDNGDYTRNNEKEESCFRKIRLSIDNILNWPGLDGNLHIRYRGASEASDEKIDYVIQYDSFEVDHLEVTKIKQRLKRPVPELVQQHIRTFKILSKYNINSIYMRLIFESAEEIQFLQTALRFLSEYYRQLRSGEILENKRGDSRFPLVYNEKDVPDLNLTLMALFNGIGAGKLQAVVDKITEMMQDKKSPLSNGRRYLSVYEAIFGVKNLPFQVKRPLIEINNLKWFFPDSTQQMITREMAEVIQMATDYFGGLSLTAVRMMESVYGNDKVYGNDFKKVENTIIEKRLSDADILLDAANRSPQYQGLEKEIYTNVGKRLSKMQDDSFGELFAPKEVVEVRGQRKQLLKSTEILSGLENIKLKKMIHFYKKRASTRNKIKVLPQLTAGFDAVDYQMISKEFKITIHEVKDLIMMIKNCFDDQGWFDKQKFETSMKWLLQYEGNIFEFLWCYLKSLDSPRSNRVACLNSLQLFIDKIKQREKALRIILSDVFRDPTLINFSDRNAMMLANILIRKYNKEIHLDIELTPEEVLLVDRGLDRKITEMASSIIDGYQEIFLIKTITLHNMIKKNLSGSRRSEVTLPVKFLLSLEREIYTFFSMVKGSTACAVLRIAIDESKNPYSQIYHLKESSNYMALLLQRLRVIVRGFGRIGEPEDLAILYELRAKQEDFLNFGAATKQLVVRIMELTDAAIKQIDSRT